MLSSARCTMPVTVVALALLTALITGCQSNGSGSADRSLTPADFNANASAPSADGAADAPTAAGANGSGAAGSGESRSTAATGGSMSGGAEGSAGSADAGRSAEGQAIGDSASAPGSGSASATDPSSGSAGSSNSSSGSGASTTANASPAGGGPGERVVIDAMVGQVNGKPIYAGQIFKAIGEEQLERIGEQQPRLAFRRGAQRLIITELRSRVTNSLLLRQAEEDLSDRERKGLHAMMREERQKILRQYGGVRALAEEALKEKKGRTIEEELEARRKRLLIERYMHKKFRPRVHVSRREVERYYQDHYNKFNPTPTVKVRMIVVREPKTAERVQKALSSGEPFKEVARRYSDVRSQRGGLMPAFHLTGAFDEFDSLRWPTLNKAVRKLEEGEHSGRVELDIGSAWVKLEELNRGEQRSLEEVFLQIERRLRAQKMDRLQRRHIEKLMENGNFTPVDRMASALLEVAMARYARPAQ